MLTHPTLEKLQTLRLPGMLKALEEQQRMPDIDSLDFEERLGLLIDRAEKSQAQALLLCRGYRLQGLTGPR